MPRRIEAESVLSRKRDRKLLQSRNGSEERLEAVFDIKTMRSILIVGMLLLPQSLKAGIPIQAEEAKWDSAPVSSSGNARLVVNRAPNFGILESVDLFVDGVQVANLEHSQRYDAVLPPGQHVLSISTNPKANGQKPTQRRVDAKPGKTYEFTAVWRSAEYASLEQ